jgi:hypothetical protein
MENVEARIIRTDGTFTDIQPNNKKDFSLKELQEIVGGYIEIVHFKNGMIMVVDEEGKLKGYDYNKEACKIFLTEYSNDFIVGNILYCKRKFVK